MRPVRDEIHCEYMRNQQEHKNSTVRKRTHERGAKSHRQTAAFGPQSCAASFTLTKRSVLKFWGLMRLVFFIDNEFKFSPQKIRTIIMNALWVRIAPAEGALSAALRSVEPNTTIALSAGTYMEPAGLICDVEGVSIIGSDDSNGLHSSNITGDVILLGDRPFFNISSTKFLIKNVNIEISCPDEHCSSLIITPDHAACCLLSKTSEAVFDHCRISTWRSLIGFSVTQRSRPVIRYCDIVNSKW